MPKLGMRPVRRQQAAEAALKVIAREGLANATIRDIAQETGVSAGVINHFFANRQELLEETLRWNEAQFEAAVRQAIAHTQDPWERLATLIDYNLCDPHRVRPSRPWTYREALTVWLEYWAAATRDRHLRATLVTTHRAWRALIAECIRYGVEQERFRPVHAEHAARLLAAFMTGLVVEWLVDEASYPEPELAVIAKELARALVGRRDEALLIAPPPTLPATRARRTRVVREGA